MSNRFDLEQQILDCWHVTDDLELIYKDMLDNGMTVDRMSNVLLGLKTLYEMKFNQMWNTFETCVRNNDL